MQKNTLLKTYKGLILSDFQVEAIEAIEEGRNVLVSTHTGNGKTLIADYAVELCSKERLSVIYTAPIKALSNQKYNQFKAEFGEDKVGLITGDRVINPEALVLVVTTEILRNLLHESPDRVEQVRYIILDEIHFMNDEERGTVWEEIIIFKQPQMRLIGLSATIPNVKEIANWIRDIHKEDVAEIVYPDRIVKQQHRFFDRRLKSATAEQIRNQFSRYQDKGKRVPYKTVHTDFVEYAVREQILPVLYFVFSRRGCEEKSWQAAGQFDLLSSEQKERVQREINHYELQYPEIIRANSWTGVKQMLLRGVGYHHAGLLPIIKLFMEKLFEERLCLVLYTTETFSVGINYPVKTVCFDSLRKFDGKNFRNLNGSEYLQMSGRAGRRGIDKFGLVYVLSDYVSLENGNFIDPANYTGDGIRSQFSLNYNTVLNLCHRFDDNEIRTLFRRSLAGFQYRRDLSFKQRGLNKVKNKREKALEEYRQGADCHYAGEDKCYLVFHDNRRRLRNLKKRVSQRKHPSKKLRDDVKHLAQLTALKPFTCSKKKRSWCERRWKRLVNWDKDISRREADLQEFSRQAPEVRLFNEYIKRRQLLRKLGYITDENELLVRGEVCSRLHGQEILVTEMLFDGFFHRYDEDMINSLLAGLVFEDEKYENYSYNPMSFIEEAGLLVDTLHKEEIKLGLSPSLWYYYHICPAVYEWSRGGEFFAIVEKIGMAEGNFVALLRRIIDITRQLGAAVDDPNLKAKLRRCRDKLDRDMIRLGW